MHPGINQQLQIAHDMDLRRDVRRHTAETVAPRRRLRIRRPRRRAV